MTSKGTKLKIPLFLTVQHHACVTLYYYYMLLIRILYSYWMKNRRYKTFVSLTYAVDNLETIKSEKYRGIATIFGPPRKQIVWTPDAAGYGYCQVFYFIFQILLPRASSTAWAPRQSRGLQCPRYATKQIRGHP